MTLSRAERLAGCLIGTAVGDSLLLPGEGMSRRRIARRFPGPLRHRFLFGRGMISDDTEHHFLVARCLARHRDPQRFGRALAWRWRWWICCLPAGLGRATLLACLRLWCGWPWQKAGVRSQGNGPAMRSAIIGVVHGDDADLCARFVEAATVSTHREPIALQGALLVALTAADLCRAQSSKPPWVALQGHAWLPEWRSRLDLLEVWDVAGEDVDGLARRLDCAASVSGWSLHSIPLALGAWWRHRDDACAGLTAIWRCGGDTDTIGAIAGALYGIDRGEDAFPKAWVTGIRDWPITVDLLCATGRALAASSPLPRWAWPAYPLRNALFLLIVVLHGWRRMLHL